MQTTTIMPPSNKEQHAQHKSIVLDMPMIHNITVALKKIHRYKGEAFYRDSNKNYTLKDSYYGDVNLKNSGILRVTTKTVALIIKSRPRTYTYAYFRFNLIKLAHYENLNFDDANFHTNLLTAVKRHIRNICSLADIHMIDEYDYAEKSSHYYNFIEVGNYSLADFHIFYDITPPIPVTECIRSISKAIVGRKYTVKPVDKGNGLSVYFVEGKCVAGRQPKQETVFYDKCAEQNITGNVLRMEVRFNDIRFLSTDLKHIDKQDITLEDVFNPDILYFLLYKNISPIINANHYLPEESTYDEIKNPMVSDKETEISVIFIERHLQKWSYGDGWWKTVILRQEFFNDNLALARAYWHRQKKIDKAANSPDKLFWEAVKAKLLHHNMYQNYESKSLSEERFGRQKDKIKVYFENKQKH